MIDYQLSPAVEKRLAEGPSAQIPLNPHVQTKRRVQSPQKIKNVRVDFTMTADWCDTSAQLIRDEFATGTKSLISHDHPFKSWARVPNNPFA